MKSNDKKKLKHEAEASVAGAIAGAAMGAVAGPPGMIAGGIVGTAVGALAGMGIDNAEDVEDAREKLLD